VPAAGTGLRVEVGDRVARICLDRPAKRNAQTPAMWRALREVGGQLGEDVRVVVVTGQGPSFSAGLDLRMFTPGGIAGELSLPRLAGLDPQLLDAEIAAFQDGFSWLRDPRFVSVAAVQGHAVGAGLQLALACDLRILAGDAQLSMREPTLGLVPDLGGTQPLVEAVGYSRALWLCATGASMSAGQALAAGLAVAVVPAPDLAAATEDLVSSLLAAPHAAVSATKELLQGARQRSYPEQLAAERRAQADRLANLAGPR
jgi:enoyl-CoA hydratase/carnithine racemase